MSIPVTRLNHAVLYVRNVERASRFYRDTFGFEAIGRAGGRMAFLRAAGSQNHHDLGLMEVGEHAPAPVHGATGLYHLAWQVATIESLAAARELLIGMDALVGQSDHGATKSVYGIDPDGNEFEVMYMLPREEWGEYERSGVVMPLNMDEELARGR